MKKFIKIILVILLITVMGLIYNIGNQELNSNELILITIILFILSVLATWIASYYYSESSNKNIIDQVKIDNQDKLKMYALKASEKVNNLSLELNKLSSYLANEIEQDYENLEEENFCKTEKLKSAIHIIGTLKSINDNALSDWEGVISDELEEQKEEKRESEEKLAAIVERFEDIISDSKNDENVDFMSEENDNIKEEIKDLKKNIDLMINNFSGIRIRHKKNQKIPREDVNNKCPFCKEETKYRQRPNINSFTYFNCKVCNKKIIGSWNIEKGFVLKKPELLNETIECPWCKEKNTLKLSSLPQTIISCKCENCKKPYKVTRRANNIIAKPIGEGQTPKVVELLNEELITKIKELLPAQPWPSGIHKEISKELEISNSQVSKAIQILVRRGEVKLQIEGKLYIEDEIK